MGSGGSEGWEKGCTAAFKRKEQIIAPEHATHLISFFFFPPEFLRLLAVSEVRVLTAFCASPNIPSHTRGYKSPPAHSLSVCLLLKLFSCMTRPTHNTITAVKDISLLLLALTLHIISCICAILNSFHASRRRCECVHLGTGNKKNSVKVHLTAE